MSQLSLSSLEAPKGNANKSRKRIGRGNSGKGGTYAGRGLKGQKSRSGVSGLKLKGMRQRLLTIPKLRGFKGYLKKPALVSVGKLDKLFKANDIVSPKSLIRKGAIDTPRYGVKILGDGKIKKSLTVRKCKVSASAKEKIEKAGGKIE